MNAPISPELLQRSALRQAIDSFVGMDSERLDVVLGMLKSKALTLDYATSHQAILRAFDELQEFLADAEPVREAYRPDPVWELV